MNKIITLVLINIGCMYASFFLYAQDTTLTSNDPEGQYAQWKAILQYGTESELISILPTLADQRVSEVSSEVRALFDGIFSDTLLVAVIQYFNSMPQVTIETYIANILEKHQTYSEQLILEALYYMRNNLTHTFNTTTLDLTRVLIMQDESIPVARAAIDVIAVHGNASDAVMLEELLDSANLATDIRGGVILAIGELRINDLLLKLHAILEDEQEPIYLRQYAVTSIGKIYNTMSISTLLDFATHANARLRADVIKVLAEYNTLEHTSILHGALRDSNDTVRLFAIQAFHNRPLDPDSLDIIKYKALNDPSRAVQTESILVLAQENSKEGRGYLREQIRNPKIAFINRAEMIVRLIEYDYALSKDVIASIVSDELDGNRNSYFLKIIAQRLANLDAPHAIETYSHLLSSNEEDTLLYALQGINRNNISELEDTVKHIAEHHNNVSVQRQAIFVLDRWEEN